MKKSYLIFIFAFIFGSTALAWGTVLGVFLRTDFLGVILSFPGIFFMEIFGQAIERTIPELSFFVLLIANGIIYSFLTWIFLGSINFFLLPLIDKREVGREIAS